MTFNSIDVLKNYILSRSEIAVKLAQEEVYKVIDKFVKQYYKEYTPEMYERTYQLYRSLVKSDIKLDGNCWVAEVYFDLGALDYHIKMLNGKEYPNKGWSEQKTLSSAAHGHHGGKFAGTAIWDDPMIEFWKTKSDILKSALIKAGIPVK